MKDNDCDGTVEEMPVASASYDSSQSSLQHCDTIYLDGAGSYDPDGDTITHAWELTSAPTASAGTTADIVNTTDESPTFYPDEAGDYVFTLTVTDSGGSASYPDTLSLTIGTRVTNSTPVADAGSDQSYSETTSCTNVGYSDESCDDCSATTFTLDGSASSDADSDSMTYQWTLDYSSSGGGTLSDDTSVSPTVTFDATSASYGSTNTSQITLSLEVTDCYGASDSDDYNNGDGVNLYVYCTGS
jgi:hypothetical protein